MTIFSLIIFFILTVNVFDEKKIEAKSENKYLPKNKHSWFIHVWSLEIQFNYYIC
jgi:hypothetical protein